MHYARKLRMCLRCPCINMGKIRAFFFLQSSAFSFAVKTVVSVSTLILLTLIVGYHGLEIQVRNLERAVKFSMIWFLCNTTSQRGIVQLFLIDNSADDWRIALTWRRCSQLALELVICSVHPPPGNFSFMWTATIYNHDKLPKTVRVSSLERRYKYIRTHLKPYRFNWS